MLRRETNFNLGRSSRRAIVSSIPIVALLLLGGMVVWGLAPVGVLSNEEVSAVGSEASMGANLIATFSSYESASVTLTMADRVSGYIVPEKDGSFTNLATTAKVDVANSDYYDLSIYGTSMQNSGGDVAIGAVAPDSKPSEFGSNTWGYSLVHNTNGQSGVIEANSNTVYQPVPTTSTNILRQNTDTETKAANDTYTLNFGAKVDASLPAGSYSSTVTLSVVANPAFIATGFDRVSTMQELTPEICREIGTAADNYGKPYAYTDPLGNTYWTKQLQDERDDKVYWVAKLADGNCWMTQNLALDITEKGLTPELTDITEPWNSQSEYPPVETESQITLDDVNATTASVRSWNFGDYVVAYPTRAYSCGAGKTTAAECPDQLIPVSSRKASTNPTFLSMQGSTYTEAEYDAHYLVGNFYQWSTATAGTGNKISDGDANGSICPKNWKLPTGSSLSGSYVDLFSKIDDITVSILASEPYFFARSGRIRQSANLFSDAGNNVRAWTSTINSDNTVYAYSLYINGSYTISGANDASGRIDGFSVRCLVNTSN